MTEMQKQFEEWAATDEGLSLKLSFPLLADNSVSSAVYASAQTRVAWQAWQASRAAIVVKLPDFDCYDTPRQALEACEDRLNDAGVSYE